jgi:hypothetical protein
MRVRLGGWSVPTDMLFVIRWLDITLVKREQCTDERALLAIPDAIEAGNYLATYQHLLLYTLLEFTINLLFFHVLCAVLVNVPTADGSPLNL